MMNQKQNNLNPNNFNTQGNNGMPNNQPLNNQSMSFNQQPINPQPQQTPSFQQSTNQMNMQQPTPQPINNTFESVNANNQNFNSKPPKKINLGLIIGILVIIGAVIVVSMFLVNNDDKQNQNNNNSNNNTTENSNFATKVFYIINDSQDKGSLAMATNFESEKIDNYNYIEKYNMKWTVGSKLYIMPVPVIPNRTYSLNGYSTEMVEMQSDILTLDYTISSETIDKTKVETLLQNTISEYNNGSVYTLNKNTEVIESNGVIGYAYSIKTLYSTQIRAWYYTKVDNKISSDSYVLSGLLTFDVNNYDNVKPIIQELSNSLGFDIIGLTEQVK